jgi:phage gp36-like protein
VRADITRDIVSADLDAMLDDRSRYADDYLVASGRYTLPLTAWGGSLTLAVAQLTAWDVMTAIVGMNPDEAANGNWIERRNEAQRWLEGVAAGRVVPIGIVDSTPDATENPVAGASDTLRGW